MQHYCFEHKKENKKTAASDLSFLWLTNKYLKWPKIGKKSSRKVITVLEQHNEE